MKKLILSSLVVFSLGFISANAAPVFENESLEILQDETKTEVDVAELPETVTTALATDDNKDWTISKAFLVKKEEKEYYAIDLTKDTESKTVNVSKEGEKM